MSKYTTQLRFYCEQLAGLTQSEGYNKVEEIIAKARPLIFDFDYPSFDEPHKTTLESKILRHFYLREIGQETIGVWKLYLNDELNIIMPYYVALENEILKFQTIDYYNDVNYTRKREGTNNEDIDRTKTDKTTTDEVTTVNTEGQNIQKFSETPQGSLTNVLNGTYLTNAQVNDVNNLDDTSRNIDVNGTSTGKENKTGGFDELETVSGKQGSTPYTSLTKDAIELLRNIDEEIIKQLEPLFMLIY